MVSQIRTDAAAVLKSSFRKQTEADRQMNEKDVVGISFYVFFVASLRFLVTLIPAANDRQG